MNVKFLRAGVCASLLVVVWPVCGQTWVTIPGTGGEWTSIASSADGGKLVASQSEGAIYTSTDFGATWISNSAPHLNWHSVASSADGTLLAAAVLGGVVYTSTNSGGTWVSNNVPVANWSCIAVSANGTTLAAGTDQYGTGAIYLSTNSGATWTSNSAPAAGGCFAITFAANGTKVAAVVDGGFCTSDDGGNTWITQSNTPNQLNLSLASSADGNKLVMGAGEPGGITGYVYISKNGGVNWTQTLLPAGDWGALASSADGTKLIAANYDGDIYSSSDSGNTWVTNLTAAGQWSGITSSADGDRLALCVYPGQLAVGEATPSPVLNLIPSGGNLQLSWIIPSTNFVLQQDSNLATGDWLNVTNLPNLDPTNLETEVILSSSGCNEFYRLKMQ